MNKPPQRVAGVRLGGPPRWSLSLVGAELGPALSPALRGSAAQPPPLPGGEAWVLLAAPPSVSCATLEVDFCLAGKP